ncbi:MAG: methylase N-4/N-6 domain protein [Candidatus Shapirobacteria bacterium GW2011_GWE1_38_92]|uniref:Methyltransferase n=2 Tax=Candidatus Shapironibacteriota TaxID=1752721 RepID=A0A0G0JVI8_9BACT|nr:MAG: methylase N-4/N-6 domain protein [Candidatus Shapirobacteria bacterium GW2011_GWE2_38_30]KKQ92789.1 MAG: methylase N-4/N-6 domain protein [Candidatus Shapirobacteria bacterium GW2011_GWE1_38_92]HAP37800.1 restriction endonuclease subunit M [Candidatus Shapirobacteria bacterium]HCU55430.1 restriction endonuclease subunit M [Candidatus Shapirobacteria bacterium]
MINKPSLPTLFGDDLRKGHFQKIKEASDSKEPVLYYSHPHGEIWLGDSEKWLKTLDSESVDLVFADPPYNIKKAEWDNFESQEKYIEWSLRWIEEASRVLNKNGSLYICGFSEILADLKHPAMRFFKGCRWIIWHYKNKANLGNDWGRSHESILHLRKSKKFIFNVDYVRIPYGNHTLKYPVHPQAVTSQYGKEKNGGKLWSPNPLGAKPRDVLEIPTISNGAEERTSHPTQKPEELLRKIILASSNEDDLVIDPFLGSGTTIATAEQLKRRWKGCDISASYCKMAADRVEMVKEWSVDRWVKFDQENTDRRKSIR